LKVASQQSVTGGEKMSIVENHKKITIEVQRQRYMIKNHTGKKENRIKYNIKKDIIFATYLIRNITVSYERN